MHVALPVNPVHKLTQYSKKAPVDSRFFRVLCIHVWHLQQFYFVQLSSTACKSSDHSLAYIQK